MGLKYTSPKKRTDPTMGLKFTSPKKGRTLPWVNNLQVLKKDGRHHGLEIYTDPLSRRTSTWTSDVCESKK